MLITVYQLKFRRFVPVKEYYWWNIPITEADTEVKSGREPCPGCGKVMSRNFIRTEHICTGTLTARPADNTRYLRNRRWIPARGEPDPEGCPVPTAAEVRAMYNADINAGVRARRLAAQLPETLDDCEIYDYTNTTAVTSQPTAG